jgi:hypothetical protein
MCNPATKNIQLTTCHEKRNVVIKFNAKQADSTEAFNLLDDNFAVNVINWLQALGVPPDECQEITEGILNNLKRLSNEDDNRL